MRAKRCKGGALAEDAYLCAQVGTRAPFKEWMGGSVRLRDLGATGYAEEPAMSAAQV